MYNYQVCLQNELLEARWRNVRTLISRQKRKVYIFKMDFSKGSLLLIFLISICSGLSYKRTYHHNVGDHVYLEHTLDRKDEWHFKGISFGQYLDGNFKELANATSRYTFKVLEPVKLDDNYHLRQVYVLYFNLFFWWSKIGAKKLYLTLYLELIPLDNYKMIIDMEV